MKTIQMAFVTLSRWLKSARVYPCRGKKIKWKVIGNITPAPRKMLLGP